jgi:hypothetical protein
MLICCLCNEPIRLGQFLIRIQGFVRKSDCLEIMVLEDGNSTKYAHYLCPVKFGAPGSLIGLGVSDG